jgi:hypothetical protein
MYPENQLKLLKWGNTFGVGFNSIFRKVDSFIKF